MEVFRCTVPVTLVLKRGVEILSEAQPDENSVRTMCKHLHLYSTLLKERAVLKHDL